MSSSISVSDSWGNSWEKLLHVRETCEDPLCLSIIICFLFVPSLPAMPFGAAVSEIQDAIFIKVKIIAEFHGDAVNLCNNRLCLTSFRSHLEYPQVCICNPEIACLLVEAQTQGTPTNMLKCQIRSWRILGGTNFWPNLYDPPPPPQTNCTQFSTWRINPSFNKQNTWSTVSINPQP